MKNYTITVGTNRVFVSARNVLSARNKTYRTLEDERAYRVEVNEVMGEDETEKAYRNANRRIK